MSIAMSIAAWICPRGCSEQARPTAARNARPTTERVASQRMAGAYQTRPWVSATQLRAGHGGAPAQVCRVPRPIHASYVRIRGAEIPIRDDGAAGTGLAI